MNQTSQQPSLKEKQSHGTHLFPCAYYHFCNPSLRLRARHHWHEEVEIVYTELSGNVFYLFSAENFIICVPCVWNLINWQLFSHHLCSFSRIMTRSMNPFYFH